VWKYYKHAFRINSLVRNIITHPESLCDLLHKLTDVAVGQFDLEEKNGKTAHFKTLNALA
jgi:hypothetical protein